MSQQQPSNSQSGGQGESFWHNLFHSTADRYDLSRQLEQEQKVYRENRLAQHMTPHLVDQAVSLFLSFKV